MSGRAVRLALPLAAALALAGAGIATYLTVVHYAHQPIACSAIGNCELVNSSEYAKVGAIPVALLGAAAYVSMLALVAGAWLRRDAMLLLAAWGIALGSFAFSLYLTYIELRVLYAICVYCVASASVVTALLAVLSAGVWGARDELLGGGAATAEGGG
ncbi:MAG: vitamin K epoxide reductase family protein [Chloroflexota bacterium]|nr:vitamin K epoxide reductase family protein [Chloroflexota bacterium]